MKLVFALMLLTQNFTQRGSVEASATVYPQSVTNDSSHVVGDVLFRDEGFYKPRKDIRISGGIDLRTDSHHQVERTLHFSTSFWEDRELQRPMLSIRRLSIGYHRAGFDIEAGKQFIRWGRADILNPTDRFAPRDFLGVVDTEFLAITAIRANYTRGANNIDAVWAPQFTPSRIPLAGQRWLYIPPGVDLASLQLEIPEGSQTGIRWSHVGFVEFSAAYYQGFNTVPTSYLGYPKLRMVGGDLAVPFRWLTIKTETAFFKYSDPRLDNYVQYVIQAERHRGELHFVGGYAGEIVTQKGTLPGIFDPYRGFTKSILGRLTYTIDSKRGVAMETAVRQNGDGRWLKVEYSESFGQHWRMTTGVSVIRGVPTDFLGQYSRNSHGLFAVKYSF